MGVNAKSKSLKKSGRVRNREATEKAILTAAADLFAKKGYENTRTLEIAKVAKANEALIARYFGGKEGLLMAILSDSESTQRMISGDQNRCNPIETFSDYSSGLSLEEAVLDFMKQGKAVADQRERFMRISCSRSMVDPKMADMVRTQIIERKIPLLMDAVNKFINPKKATHEEVQSAALLISSFNFMFNFMALHVYRLDKKKVERAMKLFAKMLGEHFKGRTL